jgi:hypothetical protein
MIKKIKCLFVGTLVVFSMPALAFAEEDESGAIVSVDAEVTLYNDVETQESESVPEEDETEEESVELVEDTEEEAELVPEENETEEESVELMEDTEEEAESVPEENETEEESVELVENTEEEAESDEDGTENNKFESKFRTQFMFTSLANRIELQVESAKVIADRADELEKNVDFTEIIVSMSILAEEANSYEFNLSVNSEVTKVEFESIKEKAKELSQEFRELAKGLFTQEEKASIKIELRAAKEDNKEEHKVNVQAMVNEIQLESAKKLVERMNIDATEILVKIESGEITADQIRSELKNLYKSISRDKKNELVQKYKEEKVKKNIEYKKNKDGIRTQIEIRKKVSEQKFKEMRVELKVKYDAQREELDELKRTNREAYKQRKDELKELRDFKSEELKNIREVKREEIKNIREIKREEIKNIREIKKDELKYQREAGEGAEEKSREDAKVRVESGEDKD